jgi:hypothetical protein
MGNPNKPGPYLYLVKWTPFDKAYAHKHPEDRYGMVILAFIISVTIQNSMSLNFMRIPLVVTLQSLRIHHILEKRMQRVLSCCSMALVLQEVLHSKKIQELINL